MAMQDPSWLDEAGRHKVSEAVAAAEAQSAGEIVTIIAERSDGYGDIALAWETCMAEAAAGGLPPADHVTHLMVHGVLHLLGYDHEVEAEAEAMEALETKILAGLGVPDPYRG